MQTARKIAHNIIFNIVSKIASTTLALVGIGFVTRYMGADGFGDYATIIAFFSFFGSIADLGFYSIATREISRNEEDQKKIIGNVFSLRVISSMILFLISPIIVFFLPYSMELKKGILIAAASFVFSSSYMVLNGIFQKNIAMHKVSIVELFGKLLQVGVIIFVAKSNLGFLAMVSSLLVATSFDFCLIYWMSLSYVKFRPQFDFQYWKTFVKEAFPMGLSVLITFLYFKLDTILLSFFKSSADVGIYNAAYKVIENITFVPSIFIGLVLPLISKSIFSDKNKFIYIANKLATIFFILVVPMVIGTMFLAGDIIGLIGGSEFVDSVAVLQILIFSLAFIFFGHFFNVILVAGNLQKKLMFASAFCALFNISANIFLIPKYSYMGSAAVSLATEGLVVLLTGVIVFRQLSYLPKISNWQRIIFSGFIMGIFLYVFSELNFLVLVLAGALIYFMILWITKAIDIAELSLLIFNKKLK